jgi:phosphate-selective porin OprO/OprP
MIQYRYLLLAGVLSVPGVIFAKSHKSYPTYKLGGQVVADTAFFTKDNDTQSDQEIRRARLYLKGALTKKLSYELEYSFTGGGSWKDLYLKYTISNLSSLTVGNIKEPFGLEALTSSKYNTFMERALPDSFISDRKLGMLMQYGFSKKKCYVWRISGGVFTQPLEEFKTGEDEYTFAARTTYLALLGKKHLLHMGFSGAYTNYNDQKIKLSTRPEAHLSEIKYLKTKFKHTDNMKRYGLEGFYQNRAFSLQGEYITTRMETQKESYNLFGWYLQMGYFLTDDSRRYKTKEGVFGRMQPKHPVTKGGYGAVEIASRISMLDFTEKDDNAEMKSYMIGVNWYLTSQLRLMLDISKTDIENIAQSENPEIVQMRVQYDF